MIAKPRLNSLLEKVDSRYTLISVVAKRARDINAGSKEMVERDNGNNVSVAAKEIVEEKLKYEKDDTIED